MRHCRVVEYRGGCNILVVERDRCHDDWQRALGELMDWQRLWRATPPNARRNAPAIAIIAATCLWSFFPGHEETWLIGLFIYLPLFLIAKFYVFSMEKISARGFRYVNYTAALLFVAMSFSIVGDLRDYYRVEGELTRLRERFVD